VAGKEKPMQTLIRFINGPGGKLMLLIFAAAALIFGIWTARH
jgi:hypothetical protein